MSQLHYTFDGTRYDGFCRIENNPDSLPLGCQLALVWEEGSCDVFAVRGKAGADNLTQYLRDSSYGHDEEWIAPPILIVNPDSQAVGQAQRQHRRIMRAMAARLAEWNALTDEERAERIGSAS